MCGLWFHNKNRLIRHATHPLLPFGPSLQLEFCPSHALPAVCLLGCHRLGSLCLWAVVAGAGLVPLTMVGFTRELWWPVPRWALPVLPVDRLFLVGSARVTNDPQHSSGTNGTCKRSQIVCRGEFLQAVDNSLEKVTPKLEALREDPTPDADWALWVDCTQEPARIFFSPHRTTKRDDAQARLALRRKLLFERADTRTLGRLLGVTPARASQAQHTEMAIAPMDKTVSPRQLEERRWSQSCTRH